MNRYAGKVSTCSEREWGNKTLYSWQFEGAPQWFRTEEKALTVGKCYDVSGESPNKITSIEEVEEAAVADAKPPTPSSPLSATSPAPPHTSADYWRWKQMVDLENQDQFLWRDARADATRIVCSALENDVLALGQSKGKKLDILVAQIAEVTATLVADYKER